MKIRQHLTIGLGGLISLTLFAVFALALWPVVIRVDHDWLQPLALLIGCAIYLGGVGLLFRGLHRLSKRANQAVTIGLWLILLVIQLWVATAWVAAPRADLYFVHQQAVSLLKGSYDWLPYFYTYPNNVTYTLVLAGLLKLANTLGINDTGVFLNIVQFIWIDLGVLVIWRELKHRNPARSNLLMVLVITAIPLYAYGLNAYSDTAILPLALFAIVAFRHLRHANTWQRITCWSILLSLVLTAALLLKPNFLVLIIAALMVLWFRANRSPHQGTTRAVATLLLLATLATGTGLVHNLQKSYGYQVDNDQALPVMSWVAMSWNPDYYGQYNRHDVTQMMKAPTKEAKATLAKQTLTDRLHELGTGGILYHLMQKARLFIANGTFDSFQINPAFTRTPNWYRQHRATSDWFLANWCQISYLALLLVNAGWGLQQVRRRHLSTGYLLGGVFIIGLICFHVIFWETEERYALPLLPLLLAGTAAGYRQPLNILHYSERSRWLPLGMAAAFTVLLSLAAWQSSGLMTHSNSEPVSVLSQNEGRYYQNHRVRLKPNASLTQPFTTTLPFDQLIVNNGERFPGKLTLKKANGRTVWQSKGQAPLLAQVLPLQPAGKYTLTVTNHGKRRTKLVTAPANYDLLPQSLIGRPHQYLRFEVQQSSVAPVLSNGKFWLLFGGMWLTGLLVVDRFYWYRRHI